MRPILLAVAIAIAAPAAAQYGPQPAAPAAVPLRIGVLDAFVLRDAGFTAPNDGKTFALGVDTATVARALEAGGGKGDTIVLGVAGLLVKLPGHPTIIDTGLGPGPGGKLAQSVGAAGMTPDKITDIFISHSHGDHVGGVLDAAGGLAFPKATIHMHAAEWAFLQANPANAKLAAAIAPRVKTFNKAGEILPGLEALPNPGHTPGHSVYRITSRGQHLRTLGDTAHSHILSLGHPEWNVAFDTDKAAGAAARARTLADIAASGERVFAPHFPWPSIGTIVVKGEGFAWVPDAGVKAP
ncbi:MBL fold metallo-hydrolase [alpha proteobacterium AAP81b]|nr:MBL fold metallo-hydrolase [alpha proteobacterium AAP81b]